jgi:dihydropteroate synthase
MRAQWRAKRDRFLDSIGSHPLVMGILNVTPDSFSDGGRFLAPQAAIAHAERLAAEGCDIIDVGGESTRPGAVPVPPGEELARVEALLAVLDRAVDRPLSIDSYKPAIAARAVELGAILVNDVGGLQGDPAMADTVAEAEAAIVIMHRRHDKDESIDILSDMRAFFDRSLALAARAGIPGRHIILDPGIGFGKTSRQNRDALARLGELADYGHPLLVGVSRKAFLGSLGDRAEAGLVGTIAANLAAAAAGASVFRVHDVAEHVAALRVFDLIAGPRRLRP